MKIEVPHSDRSQEYIDKTFAMYSYAGKLPNSIIIKETIVFHMYPKEDTICNGEEDLYGYEDAYNCDVKVYDVTNRVYYDTDWTDAIDVEVPCKVKVFKDLSTMIVVRRGAEIMNGHAMSVYEIGKYD